MKTPVLAREMITYVLTHKGEPMYVAMSSRESAQAVFDEYWGRASKVLANDPECKSYEDRYDNMLQLMAESGSNIDAEWECVEIARFPKGTHTVLCNAFTQHAREVFNTNTNERDYRIVSPKLITYL